MTSKKSEAKWVPFGCIHCGMGPDPARALVIDDVVVKIEGNPKFEKEWPSPSKVCGMCYGAAQKQVFIEAYDKLCQQLLLPFPQMADDPTRTAMDEAIAKALALPDLAPLRRLLAQEPVVCLKPLS